MAESDLHRRIELLDRSFNAHATYEAAIDLAEARRTPVPAVAPRDAFGVPGRYRVPAAENGAGVGGGV